jgi:hypothetical protein
MFRRLVSITHLESKKKGTIYDFDTRIDHTWKMIRTELSPDDASMIEKYDKEMVRISLSKPTHHKHLSTILSLSRMLKKSWLNASKEDIDDLVYGVMKKYSSDGKENNTTWDHKEVGDPLETKWIRIKRVKSKIVREQLLTDEDLVKLLERCLNPRDKAFLDVHYEAGTRPGEILNLKLKHVNFDRYGAFINVDGKTGPRPIRIIRSVPDLAKWIEIHPFRENPEAPLWILTESTKLGESMTYSAARGMLKRALKRAKINKKVNLKLFRHSEATNSKKIPKNYWIQR